MLRKLLLLASLGLCIAMAAAQTLVPSDNVTVQMNNSGPGQINGHLQAQYSANGQGVDQSHDALIRFNLSSLPPGLTPASIQTASPSCLWTTAAIPGPSRSAN